MAVERRCGSKEITIAASTGEPAAARLVQQRVGKWPLGVACRSTASCSGVSIPRHAASLCVTLNSSIAQGNDDECGLARGIEAGTVWINTDMQFSIATPFGGVKDSGMGREKGREGIHAWMAQKSIYYDLSGKPHPWAS
jgi:hypothetical protein